MHSVVGCSHVHLTKLCLIRLCGILITWTLCGSCFIPELLKMTFSRAFSDLQVRNSSSRRGNHNAWSISGLLSSVVFMWGGGCRSAACGWGVAECFLLWSASLWCNLRVIKWTDFKSTIQWTLTNSHLIITTAVTKTLRSPPKVSSCFKLTSWWFL